MKQTSDDMLVQQPAALSEVRLRPFCSIFNDMLRAKKLSLILDMFGTSLTKAICLPSTLPTYQHTPTPGALIYLEMFCSTSWHEKQIV